MEDKSLYNDLYNENYTDVRKNELIQRVFENKTKDLLSEKSDVFKFADGGGVDEGDKIYTPYEFLHTLLPKVYGRPYVVSDSVGKEYNEKIQKEELELEEYVNSILIEKGVSSLYKIGDKSLIEEIEVRRRKIISDKSFITETELHGYLFCHPELHTEHYVEKTPIYDVNSLIKSGVVMIDYDKKNNSYLYVYVYEYLSGNLYKKLTRLRANKERLQELGVLTDEQFIIQENALRNNFPSQGKITKDVNTCLFILPKSEFGEQFMIEPNEVVDLQMSYRQSFIETFRDWTYSELDMALITRSRTINEVHKYFTDLEPLKSSADDKEERDYADRRKKAYIDGKIALMEFLNKGLTTNCQLRLEYIWNETFNYYTEPKYYKIPVACQMSNKFKNGKIFTPNETQIQSIQFMRSVGSGLLAYGVGVGKTASAILNVSYALDNDICKKPLFIVPNPTYQKWKMEMFGGITKLYIVEYEENGNKLELSFEQEAKAKRFAKAVSGTIKERTETIYGHLSHINKVVELYNLNAESLRNIKNYSEEEEAEMIAVSELIKHLKNIPSDYNFDDESINNEIRNVYPQLNIDLINAEYMDEKMIEFNKWWNKKKNRDEAGGWRNTGLEYFNSKVFKTSKKDIFEKRIKIYKEELPYIKGTLKSFDNGTVFIATYEALEHLGLVLNNQYELSDNDSLYGSLFNEISQGDNISDINYEASNSLPTLWKESVYGSKKTKIDIGELGFDYAVFDESHLLKKVLTDCKPLPRYGTRGNTGTTLREPRRYSFGAGEKPSALALTGFFVTRFIQNNFNGNNVIHLTATPFTNKPAEIYSMLSLTNGKMLRESGFKFMQEFFDVYMDISYELIFGNTGVTRKESLLGYRNLPQLRNLIYSMMDYKSGEDANIKRPEKILFPSVEKGIETTLPETQLQDELFKQIKDYQRGNINWSDLCADSTQQLDIDELTEEQLLEYVNERGTDVQKEKFEALEKPLDEDDFDALKAVVKKLSENTTEINEDEITDQSERDSFRVIQGLGTLKAVTLSPYLSTCSRESGIEPTFVDYIQSSPKLNYTVQCIKSIHDYELQNNLPKSGCVIYMSIGVNVSYKKDGKNFKWSESGFQKIKQYLIQRMGYSEHEIVIVSGGMSNEDKERAKNSFLSGKSTVLIGSSSISTGIDLQNNASSLFLCSYDWNPTDNEQISGRIHRQGNRFEKIRVVYPMVMNSADPNIFQQLYEKTLRIKNIWDRNDRGNTLDLKDFDVNSLRKGILDEPEDLANYWREEKSEELETRDIVLDRRLVDLRNANADKSTLDDYTPVMKGMIVVLDAYKKINTKKEAEQKLRDKLNEVEDSFDDIEDVEDRFVQIAKEKAKIIKDSYDFKNDPDGRYRVMTYDEIGNDEELLKLVNRYITNVDSIFNKMSTDDKRNIYSNWLATNFPRFNQGYYDLSKPMEDDKRIYIDYDSNAPITYSNKWKGAFRGFGKIKENLKILGIEFEDIPQAIEDISRQKSEIKIELDGIRNEYPVKLQQYTLAKQERRIVQPTIQQRVDEFASYNPILHDVIITFKEDKAKYVEIPMEKLKIKPSKKIKDIIEEAVIEEEVVENKVDTSGLIEKMKEGLLVRFAFPAKRKNGNLNVVDLFYEEGEYIKYYVIENSKGEIISEVETEMTEQEIVEYYLDNHEFISEQFYGDGEEEIKEEDIEKSQPISETYKKIIEGYEFALEVETDAEKIKLYNDLIEGYKLSLELED